MSTICFAEEQRDPNLAQFSKMVKCLKQQQGSGGGVGDMDWRQWQNAANSNDLSNVWNRQTPSWRRPGEQRPPVGGPGNNQYGGSQPRPGVHPDDWNSRQPGTGSRYPGNNMNWQPNQDVGNNRDRERERNRNERRQNRNKNRRKNMDNDRQRNDEVIFTYLFVIIYY